MKYEFKMFGIQWQTDQKSVAHYVNYGIDYCEKYYPHLVFKQEDNILFLRGISKLGESDATGWVRAAELKTTDT